MEGETLRAASAAPLSILDRSQSLFLFRASEKDSRSQAAPFIYLPNDANCPYTCLE